MKWKAIKEITVMHYCEDYCPMRGLFGRRSNCKHWKICENANKYFSDDIGYGGFGCNGKFYDEVDWKSAVELGFITADDFVS